MIQSPLSPIVVFLLALTFSLLSAFLTPPLQIPDEDEHFRYTRAIASGSIVPKELNPRGVGGLIPQADMNLITVFSPVATHRDVQVTHEMYKAARAAEGTQLIPVNYWGAAIYPPVAYAVPAAGLLLADMLGFDRLSAFYAGRAANALLFSICAAFAFALAPAGRVPLTLVLLLPMTLFEAGSFSADAFVFALTPLVCAILAREAVQVDRLPRLSILVCTAIAITLLALTKAPLITMLLPLVAIAWRRSWVLAFTLFAMAVTCFILWIVTFVMTPQMAVRSAMLVGGEVSSSAQIEALLIDPLQIIPLAINTLASYGWFYAITAIGAFGWLEIYMPDWYYMSAIVIVLVIFGLSTTDPNPSPSISTKIAFGVAAIAASALVFASLYLVWSAVGADIVSGVQGRYFIPMLFLAVFSIAGGIKVHSGAIINRAAMAIPVILWIVSLVIFCQLLVERYYMT